MINIFVTFLASSLEVTLTFLVMLTTVSQYFFNNKKLRSQSPSSISNESKYIQCRQSCGKSIAQQVCFNVSPSPIIAWEDSDVILQTHALHTYIHESSLSDDHDTTEELASKLLIQYHWHRKFCKSQPIPEIYSHESLTTTRQHNEVQQVITNDDVAVRKSST